MNRVFLPVITFFLLSLCLVLQSCEGIQFNSFPTIIRILNTDQVDSHIMYILETDDYEEIIRTETLGNDQITLLDNSSREFDWTISNYRNDDGEDEYYIDWDFDFDVNPKKSLTLVFIYDAIILLNDEELIPGFADYVAQEDIYRYQGSAHVQEIQLDPKFVYTWDAATNQLVKTDEQATRNQKPPSRDTGNDGGGLGASCSLSDYNGPEFDIQVDSFCKQAFAAQCVGDIQTQQAACATYYDYGESVWVGSGSLPRCPYCD